MIRPAFAKPPPLAAMEMKLKTYTSRIDLLVLAALLVFGWFVEYAFFTYGKLFNLPLVSMMTGVLDGQSERDNLSAVTTQNLLIKMHLLKTVGLFCAFLATLIIGRRRWHWMNSTLMFVVLYLLGWIRVSIWTTLKNIFWSTGDFIESLFWETIFEGSILLLIGIVVFLALIKHYPNRESEFVVA